MSTWSREQVMTRKIVYHLPVHEGSVTLQSMREALAAACDDYTRECWEASEGDSIRVYPRDGEITVEFTLPDER